MAVKAQIITVARQVSTKPLPIEAPVGHFRLDLHDLKETLSNCCRSILKLNLSTE